MKSSYWKKLVYLLIVLAVTKVIAKTVIEGKESNVSTFVITETGKYTSLDPLDGDSSQNLPVARMLYATPVEINADNTLGSRLLESFDYDQSTKTIKWVVKDNVSYSDGSMITAEDIAFSVSRMAFTRPGFPLIKLIVGLDEWLKKSEPLKMYPSGIEVNGHTITIKLKEDYPHPLFRFCLELFSVIPKSCVNLNTNKIECRKIPTSGYYEMVENVDDTLLFQKRPSIAEIQGKLTYPSEIRFVYSDAAKILEDKALVSNKTVIQSSEAKLTREQMKVVKSNYEVSFTPAAWFTLLQVNPNIAPFDKPECRFEFARLFRKNFEIESDEGSEGSIFTKLVRGYKTLDDLTKIESQTHSNSDRARCLEEFRKSRIPWGFEKTTPITFSKAILKTAKDLGIQIDGPLEFKDRKEEVEKFVSDQSAFMYGRTGFWALDPTGDTQMLFTPNLHKGLKHFWNDQVLQGFLQTIVTNGEVNVSTVDAINNYLFQDAKLNVYSHIRRFYASKNKELVQRFPIGITSPSPWHLFGEH